MTPSEFCEYLVTHKTRMNGLSCGEESMTICSAVLIQYQRVTDGRTDRQTDVQPKSITCFSIADARKKGTVFTCVSYAEARNSNRYSLDVRPSVTRWHGIKTAQHLVMLSSPHDSPFILVFCVERSSLNSDGVTPCGGAKQRWGLKISQFSTNNSLYLRNG